MSFSHKHRPHVKHAVRRRSTSHRREQPPAPPLSPAWFEQLASVNSKQALLSRLSLEQAGTSSCCVICGDTRLVADYPVLNGDTYPFLARFCRDCAGIQQTMGLRIGPPRPLPLDNSKVG